MKVRRMWLALGGLAVGLLCVPAVQAAEVPLTTVIQGQAQAAPLYPNLPTYLVGGPTGVGVGVQGLDTAGNGRVGAALLLAAKLQLSPPELTALTQLAGNLATQCFNLSPERLVSISDWLIRQNTHPRSGVQRASFGPLDVTYRAWQYSESTQLASVVLSRNGTPGEEPWTSSCTL